MAKKHPNACKFEKFVVTLHPIWFYILKNMKKLLFSALLAAGLFAAGCSPKGQVQNAQVPGVGEVIRDTLNGVPCCVYLPEHYADRTEVYPVLYSPETKSSYAPASFSMRLLTALGVLNPAFSAISFKEQPS